jgi:hypothetical protein
VTWGTPADGLQNVPTASSLSAGAIRLYNWWGDYCDEDTGLGWEAIKCDIGTCWGSDPAALACDTADWTRDVRFDAFHAKKLTTDVTGNGDSEAPGHFCEVAQEIRVNTPTISYPVEGATDVPTSFTAVFTEYVGHRADVQNCFPGYQMNVEVDATGGGTPDWAGLIYDSGDTATGNSDAVEISRLPPDMIQVRML